MADRVELRRPEAGVARVGAALAAVATQRPAGVVPLLRVLGLATAQERPRLPPPVVRRMLQRPEHVLALLLGPDRPAAVRLAGDGSRRRPVLADDLAGLDVPRHRAVGQHLLPADVAPGQDLLMAAVRTAHEALALVAGVVLPPDAALALHSRGAGADELGPADIDEGRGALLGERQRDRPRRRR